jgi:hypothetical protein
LKKNFYAYLFNRIEEIGNEKFNHIGCEGINKECGDILSTFVPNLNDRVKVKFTIETSNIKKLKRTYELSK